MTTREVGFSYADAIMRRLFVAAVALLLLARLSIAEDGPRVRVDSPAAEESRTPYAFAVIEGRAEGAKGVRVELSSAGRSAAVEVPLGSTAVVVDVEAPSAAARAEILAALARRLPRSGRKEVAVEASGDRTAILRFGDEVDLPAVLTATNDSTSADAAQRTMTLRFAIEVLPKERYYSDVERPVSRLQETDPKKWPWSGTAEAFEQFLAAEIERWTKARDAGTAYEPSDPRYLLVPKEGDGFALLENDRASQGFTERMVAEAFVSDEPNTGVPVVLLEIRADVQEALEDFTRSNIGLPLAIVVNGRYQMAPRINDGLKGHIQITLGAKSHQELKRDADALARALRAWPAGTTTDVWAIIETLADGRFRVTVPLAGSEGAVDVSARAVGAGGPAGELIRRHVVRSEAVAGGAPPPIGVWLAERRLGMTSTSDRPSTEAMLDLLRASVFASDRSAVSEVLAATDDPAGFARRVVAALRTATGDERVGLARLLLTLAPRATDVVREAATDASAEVRRTAIEILVLDPKPEEVVLTVVQALRDPDVGVRRAALEAVGRPGLGGPSAAFDVGRLLQDPDPEIRIVAAYRLATFAPERREEAWPVLLASIRDRELVGSLRGQAAFAAMILFKPDTKQGAEFRGLIDDEDAMVRDAVAVALWGIGLARHDEPLPAALQAKIRERVERIRGDPAHPLHPDVVKGSEVERDAGK